jgi:hypothetical protein
MIATGAIALLVVMFLPWWGVSYTGSAPLGAGSIHIGASRTVSGWEWLTAQRWLWVLTIVVALVAVLLEALAREIELPVSPKVVVAGLGAVSTGFIIYRIIDHPGAGGTAGTTQNYTYGIEYGIWLGLLAAATIMLGGYVGIQEEEAALEEAQGEQTAAGASPAAAGGGTSAAAAAGTAGAIAAGGQAAGAALPATAEPSPYPAIESFKAASAAVAAKEAGARSAPPAGPMAPAAPPA